MQPIWRKAAWIGGGVLGGLFALLLLVLAFGNTGWGLRTIEWAAARFTNREVVIAGLEGRFPDSLTVAHLELRDEKGVWLTADDVALDWSPLDYLWNTVMVENFAARRIDVLRRPVSKTTSESSDTHIQIDALKIERLDVAPAVAWRAARVTVSGKVDYISLHDARIHIAARRLDAPGIYNINTDISKTDISGTIDIREPANGLIGGLTGLPDLGPLAIQASAQGPRKAQRIVLALTAGVLRADGRGIVNLDERTAQFDLAAHAPAMTPGPGVSWASLALEGHLHGSFDTPDINAHLAMSNVRAAGGSALNVKADITGHGGGALIVAQISDPKMQGLPGGFFQGAPIDLRANVTFDEASLPVTFEVSHKLAVLRGQATLGGNVAATASLDLRSLAPFAALAGLNLQGSAAATATLGVQGTTTNAKVGGTLTVTGGGGAIAGLLGRNAKFSVEGSQQNRDVTIESATLHGVALDLAADGGLRGGVYAINWTAALRDLSRVAKTLSGDLSLRGHVKGPQDNFEMTVAGDGRVAGGKAAKGPLHIAAKIGGLPSAPAGSISAEGRLNGGALRLVADLERRANGALSITIHKGDWKSLRARADLLLARGADVPIGKIVLREGRLADLEPFIGANFSGGISATADIRSQGAKPLALLSLSGKDLAVGDISIAGVALDGTIADPAGKARSDLKLVLTGLRSNGITAEAHAQLTGPVDALDVQLASHFKDKDGNKAQLRADARIDAKKQVVVLHSLDADYRGQTAHLVAPARIDLSGGVAVDRLEMIAAKAQGSVSGRFTPTLDAAVSVRNVTPALIALFVPDFVGDGVLSADAKLAGTVAAPRGTVSLHGTDLRLEGTSSGTANGELVAKATLNGAAASIDAHLSAGKSLSLAIAGNAPLTSDGEMDLNLKGTTDLALINPILNAEGRNLRGHVSVDGTVTGTQLLPRVQGSAVLADADFQDYTQGIHLSKINGRITAKGNRISLDGVTANAGKGTVSAEGDIDLWAPGIPVNLAINAKNARALSGNLMSVDVDATLKLTGQAQSHVNLIGDVHIDDGEVNLPEKLPRDVAVLDVRRKGQKPPPPPQSKAPLIGLSLTVTSPGRLFVRGRGLDAEVSGRLKVNGTNRKPDVTGGFNMRRGELSIAGQTLNFTSGRLGFNGAGLANSLDPSLDFVAESTSGSVTAKLEVTGYASSPKIKLSSTPYLPQDEVLAHLLFQQSVKQLGPLQLAQIAEGLGSLTGIGSGLNPLSRVRKGLGLDRLSVGGGENGSGASVEAGKYVMDSVYVGAKQNSSGGTQAQVQVDLTRRLRAQATVNTGTTPDVTGSAAQEDRGSSIGLSYQFDY